MDNDDAAASASATAALVLRKFGGLPCIIPLAEVFPSSLPCQWGDFRRSGPPRKMGFIIDNAGRLSRPCKPPPCVLEAFASGSPFAEYVVVPGGMRVVFDFLRKIMVPIDDENRSAVRAQPLYWVDEDGQLFMSASLGGVQGASVLRAFHRLSQGRLTVTSLRRCRHREGIVFGFLDKMKCRDCDGWLFGWYGASAAEVEEAADGGDVPPNWQLIGAEMAHGRGLHVSPVDGLEASASLSLRSAEGQPAQVLFCALAPGSREVVPAGSSQSLESNSFFHTGTDSLSRTKWYVFWPQRSARTSLLPLYAVTFSAKRPIA